jgi:hypothetical protein
MEAVSLRLALLLLAGALAAHPQPAPVSALLSQKCAQCHNDKTQLAGLNLTAPNLPPATWHKVRDRIQARTMPPAPLPGLSEADRTSLTTWIDSTYPTQSGPGRVTVRRLNRLEYNNTIRDLLGVTTRPADVFPTDNQGYGYDNIGDVLTLSPLLMEKYMAAARTVSKIAIYGEPVEPKPGLIAKFMIKTVQDDGHVSGSVLPFSFRGTLATTYHAPVEADYVLQLRMLNRRGRAPAAGGPKPLSAAALQAQLEASRRAAPPVDFHIAVDGQLVHKDSVVGEEAFDYTRGPTTVKVHLTAGDHHIHVSVPDHANLDNPRANLNPDGRRRLGAEFLDILGPYNPAPRPQPKFFTCHEPTAACAQQILTPLARRAFRRPPTNSEIRKLLNLVALVQKQGDPFQEGIRVALQSLLVSPAFLFRLETDPPQAPATYQLNPFELATRLSYFLWGSMPDDELLHLAETNQLAKPAVRAAQVRRMLQDPKAAYLIDGFATQWLDLRALDRKKPDAAAFPHVDDELLGYMRQETLLFTSEIFRQDRSLLAFLDADFTYLNGPLARYYGIPNVNGFAFQRVALPAGARGGVITQAAVLALTSYATRTSPVIRGKWVLQTLLGAAPPPPPPDVPALEEKHLGNEASVRTRLEQHRANPACAVCHVSMDPIGFGLENFDAAGGYRTHDGKFPVDSSGTLPGGQSFAGTAELKQVLLRQSAQFTRHFSEQLLTFALGRGVERSDQPTVDQLQQKLAANGNKLSALVLAIVESEPFQKRRKEAPLHATR